MDGLSSGSHSNPPHPPIVTPALVRSKSYRSIVAWGLIEWGGREVAVVAAAVALVHGREGVGWGVGAGVAALIDQFPTSASSRA